MLIQLIANFLTASFAGTTTSLRLGRQAFEQQLCGSCLGDAL